MELTGKTDVIRFGRKRNNYAEFSNFHKCKIVYEGIEYNNSEAAWQSLKTLNMEERKSFSGYSGSVAKREGRKVSLRDDWEAVKYNLMIEVCYAKFSQNPEFKSLLLSTGDKELIEDTTGWHDNTWGDCSCPKCINKPGQNLLGRALMEVRSRLADSKEDK